MMYSAICRTDGQVYAFRTLDGLARRLGGRRARWTLVHSSCAEPAIREVEVLRPTRQPACWDLVAVLVVPTAAVPSPTIGTPDDGDWDPDPYPVSDAGEDW